MSDLTGDLSVGDHNRQAYIVVVLDEGDDLYACEFLLKDDALEFINGMSDKCYLICVEHDVGNTYKIKAEPHT